MARVDPISCTPGADPALRPGVVQIWRMDAQPCAEIAELSELLAPAEQTRAAALLRAAPRAEFVCGRVLLRLLLSRATGLRPAELDLRTGQYGKPYLHGVENAPEFNLTHSAGEILVALSLSGAVGIDLERDGALRPGPARPSAMLTEDMMGIAAATFAPAEQLLLRQAHGEPMPALFLSLWTMREAVMKAVGAGLAVPPRFSVAEVLLGQRDEIEVVFAPARPPCSVFLYPLALGPGRSAALASERRLLAVECFAEDRVRGLLRNEQ